MGVGGKGQVVRVRVRELGNPNPNPNPSPPSPNGEGPVGDFLSDWGVASVPRPTTGSFFRLPPPALVLSSRFTINLYQSEKSRREKLLDEIDRHGKKQPKTVDWH